MSIFERFRSHIGWTQSELASAMGATKAAVSAWETGTRTIKPSMAHQFLAITSAHDFEACLEDVYPTPVAESA